MLSASLSGAACPGAREVGAELGPAARGTLPHRCGGFGRPEKIHTELLVAESESEISN